MRALHALERRLQDIERKFENKERMGQIVDVKFENHRWYVKLNDGDDLQPSGSQSNADPMKGEGTFKSDWQPWKSFSHGTIKMSIPPKKGQYALIRSSASGIPELSVVEPHHYGPENPSPHDKPDEVVHLIEDDEEKKGQQGGGSGGQSGGGESGGGQDGQGKDKWNHWVRQTKDMIHTIIQKKGANMDGMGQLGGLAGMAGLNGLDMSNFAGAIGGLGNIGNIANMNLGNIADFGQLSGMIGSISNFSKFADLGALAKSAGLGNLTNVGSMVSAINGSNSGGGGGGGGGGGSGGGDQSSGQQQQKEKKTRKIPEVEENGHSDTTQIKTTKEFILKTVGDKKSYYRQDEEKVHVRYGEQDKKADIFMDKDKVQVQFKDKKAMIKWTENDLTMQMGENEKSKVVMTENDITMTQGGDNASKMVMTNGDITISQGEQSSWKLSAENLLLNIGGTQWTLDASGWNQDGGTFVAHNNFNIGFNHKHAGVQPGGGQTGFPLPKT